MKSFVHFLLVFAVPVLCARGSTICDLCDVHISNYSCCHAWVSDDSVPDDDRLPHCLPAVDVPRPRPSPCGQTCHCEHGDMQPPPQQHDINCTGFKLHACPAEITRHCQHCLFYCYCCEFEKDNKDVLLCIGFSTARGSNASTTTASVSMTAVLTTTSLKSSWSTTAKSSQSLTAVSMTTSQSDSTETMSTAVNVKNEEQPNAIGIIVGVILGVLLLLALIIFLIVIVCRRRRKSAVDRQSSNTDLPPVQTASLPRSSNVYQDHVPRYNTEYEEITDIGVAPPQTSLDASINNYELATVAPSAPIYARPNNLSLSSSPAAASVPVSNVESSVYNDTSTTLVDNALYEAQQPTVTSSNVAETADDVTDHTLIDNDLYGRAGQGQGQQSSGSTDAPAASVPFTTAATDMYHDTSTTLVDNPLYDAQQPSVTSSNTA